MKVLKKKNCKWNLYLYLLLENIFVNKRIYKKDRNYNLKKNVLFFLKMFLKCWFLF